MLAIIPKSNASWNKNLCAIWNKKFNIDKIKGEISKHLKINVISKVYNMITCCKIITLFAYISIHIMSFVAKNLSLLQGQESLKIVTITY